MLCLVVWQYWMSFSCHLTCLLAIWKGFVLCGASLESLLSDFWGEVSADRLAVLKSWGCDATQDIPGSLILVTHWSGLVSRGIVCKCFCYCSWWSWLWCWWQWWWWQWWWLWQWWRWWLQWWGCWQAHYPGGDWLPIVKDRRESDDVITLYTWSRWWWWGWWGVCWWWVTLRFILSIRRDQCWEMPSHLKVNPRTASPPSPYHEKSSFNWVVEISDKI